MTQTVTLDGAKLKAIGHASHTAEVTMTALAMRERLRHFSDITRTRNQLVRNGERLVEEDYMAFWKSLQDAGVGVIVYGRKGRPDRFEWHYSLKKVAKASLEGTNESAEKIGGSIKKPKVAKFVKKGKNIPAKVESKIQQKVNELRGRSVFIPLRPDFDLELPIPPKGYSNEDIDAITRAMRRFSA
jgi:hypothetical protein